MGIGNSKIVGCIITTDCMPNIISVIVPDGTEHGTEHVIAHFYPDEISFREEEFVGLTVDEAIELFRKRDIAYLQS